jgi:hypothetical protein
VVLGQRGQIHGGLSAVRCCWRTAKLFIRVALNPIPNGRYIGDGLQTRAVRIDSLVRQVDRN